MTSAAAPWTVMIVEDDAAMREYFAHSVQDCPQLALACALATVADACQWLRQPGQAVDVLLTDLGLPDGSGLEVIRCAAVAQPSCEALVISMFGDDDYVLSSIEAGALGYIHKDDAPQDVVTAILQMKAGGSPISPMIARRVLARYASERVPMPARAQAPAAGGGGALLSVRESEVLELIARGFSYREIAQFQQLSVHTVQSHIKSLYRKLAVHSRGEAVYEARQLGLLGV